MIKAIKKVDVVEKAYEQLKENIANGTWSPGQKIPSENQLAKKFNVSRNSVRSAIQKLKAMGVLSAKQGSGTIVCDGLNSLFNNCFIPFIPLTREEMIQILEFRMVLDIEGARLAAMRASDEDIENIKRNLDGMFLSLNDYEKYTMADFQFHLSILKASKNDIFYEVMLNLQDTIFNYMKELNSDEGCEFNVGFERHKQVFDAIRNRDPEMAVLVSKRNFGKDNDFLLGVQTSQRC